MDTMDNGKRKICLVANTTWYVYNFRMRLIGRLLDLGHQVTVLSPTDAYVGKLTSRGVTHVHLTMWNASTNVALEGLTLVRLLWTIGRIRPGVLLTFTPKLNIYCSIVARVLGIGVIANVSGLGRGFVKGGVLRSMSELLYRIAFKHPRVVFFQNTSDLRLFVEKRLVEERKSASLPGSGVDVDRFTPRPRRRFDGAVRFLLLSRLLWDKGVGEYVEAARHLRCEFDFVQCCLLGFLDVENPSAVSRESILRWHREGVVEYLGATDDVVPHLADADCVVLPSYYREGVPRSLLEAASMGIPIITTDMPGCRDVVEDGVTGFVCEPKNAQDLADRMRRIVLMPDAQRRVMGAAGRNKIIREFDERVVLDRYEVALDVIPGDAKVLGEKHRSA